MSSRLHAALFVILIVAAIAGLPGLIPSLAPEAHAEPRSVTVATYDQEPFVITEGDVKYGFTIDILEEIAKRAGWTYTYIDGGNIPGLMKAVQEGRADFAATDISITAEREKMFNFSQPIISAGLQIIVPSASTDRVQPGLADFVKLLFSKTMVVWLLGALALTIVPAPIIWLLGRGDPGSMVARSYFPGIFQAFGWGLGMLAAAPFDPPRHWPIRMVTVLWTFISIIFVAYYTAILTTNLTVARIDSHIDNPGELVDKKVCTVANTTSPAALNKLGVRYTGLPKVEDCYRGLENGEFQAVVYDAPVLEYYVTHSGAGKAAVAGPVFKDEDYGIVFPIGSKLKEAADEALLSIQEDGQYELIKKKWFGEPE
ncbi:MAG: transporter substrate-binding domain-containing protein [Mycobacterium sp.]|nr:transporter substrate-binding domain-containing protein [Mycobacterium sp.]